MKRYYIGLSTTFHDPSVSIVDNNGKIIFAEASERYLQNKQAYDCAPDHILGISKILKEYCADATHFTVVNTWNKKFYRYLKWLSRFGLSNQKSF
jgi:carbamoyltransferase